MKMPMPVPWNCMIFWFHKTIRKAFYPDVDKRQPVTGTITVVASFAKNGHMNISQHRINIEDE